MSHHNSSISRRRFLQLAAGSTLVSAAGVLTACAGRAPASALPAAVRLAYFPNFTHAPALVGMQRGSFEKVFTGAGTKLDAKSFNAGPELIEALLAGEIDLGYVGPSPAINGYVKSKGSALRVIAGASSGGALFIVRPEAKIAAATDLAGKKIATPQRGGTQDVALRHYVQAKGLKTADDGGDVTIVPTKNPDILTLFKQGQIDGAWVPEPWGTRLLQEAGGAVFIDERTLWPDGKFVTTLVVASAKFLAAQPALVRGFLDAHLDSLDFIRSSAAEAKTLSNKEIERITTKALSAKVIDAAFANVEFTHDPLEATLFQQADYAFDLGFLGKEKPDLKGIFDLSILKEALR